jgi:hypothetical protein
MKNTNGGMKYSFGLSFPGKIRGKGSEWINLRDTVEGVADFMSTHCRSKSKVLYDLYHKGTFARPNLDEHLPEEYRKCNLIVVFLCKEYSRREWCLKEWRIIHELTQDQEQRHRVMYLWHGKRDDRVLRTLGLDWDKDGFIAIDKLKPKEIWEEVLARDENNHKELASNDPAPVAASIGLPSGEPRCSANIKSPIQRLAVILSPPGGEYATAERYEITFYIKAGTSDSYVPLLNFDAGREFIDLKTAYSDWSVIAQSLAAWASEASRGDAPPTVELFIPYELLQELLGKDFLNIRCLAELDDDFTGKSSFSSLCPIVIRPVDRYLRPSLNRNIIHLRKKFSRLLDGNGRWIYGDDAASCETLIARRDVPEDVAVRMVHGLPGDEMAVWLKKLIGSMVPIALWWAIDNQVDREGHLLKYKCESRSILEIGPEGKVMMKLRDLDLLPLERKRLTASACSLVLMVDNPDLVPDHLISPLSSHTVRSMS